MAWVGTRNDEKRKPALSRLSSISPGQRCNRSRLITRRSRAPRLPFAQTSDVIARAVLAEAELRLTVDFSSVRPDEEVVVYCASVDCHAGLALYHELVARDYRDARRYEGGLTEWEEAGLPLEGEWAPNQSPPGHADGPPGLCHDHRGVIWPPKYDQPVGKGGPHDDVESTDSVPHRRAR